MPVIDADSANRELFHLLNVKSSSFKMNGQRHKYNHEEPIFFRTGPIDEGSRKSIKKCPSCQYTFSSRDEMVYCTFCGLSNDQKCMNRTRFYPHAAKDENNLHVSRGPICKLCTYKFFVHERVSKVIEAINAAKISMSAHLKNLESQGDQTIAEK